MKTRQVNTMITSTSSSASMAIQKKINVASHKVKKHVKESKSMSKSNKKPMKPMSPVQVKAEEKRSILQLDLSKSFIKLMKPSIVGSGHWLGLPSYFCSSMLPKVDTDFTLVDEDNEEYPDVKYQPRNNGMSGGWRWFSNAHELKKEDALIFHLTKDTEFKVYIVRGEAESEKGDNEEESQEVLTRKKNVRLKIMNQERELIRIRNDALWRNREIYMKILESKSSKDDQLKSGLASSSINSLSLE